MFLDEAECLSPIEVVARCAKLACRRRGQTYPDGQIALELGSAHGWLGFGAAAAFQPTPLWPGPDLQIDGAESGLRLSVVGLISSAAKLLRTSYQVKYYVHVVLVGLVLKA